MPETSGIPGKLLVRAQEVARRPVFPFFRRGVPLQWGLLRHGRHGADLRRQGLPLDKTTTRMKPCLREATQGASYRTCNLRNVSPSIPTNAAGGLAFVGCAFASRTCSTSWPPGCPRRRFSKTIPISKRMTFARASNTPRRRAAFLSMPDLPCQTAGVSRITPSAHLCARRARRSRLAPHQQT